MTPQKFNLFLECSRDDLGSTHLVLKCKAHDAFLTRLVHHLVEPRRRDDVLRVSDVRREGAILVLLARLQLPSVLLHKRAHTNGSTVNGKLGCGVCRANFLPPGDFLGFRV